MNAIEQKITDHFNSIFSHPISETEIKKVIECDCECDCCGTNIFEMDDFPVFRDDRFLCPQCELDKYYTTCPICQDHFEKATKAEDYTFIISKECVDGEGMELKPGFYKTNSWPFFYGSILSGFDNFYPGSIDLIHECDINSMLRKLNHGSADEVNCDEVCNGCFGIWTGKTPLVNNYCNQEYGAEYIKKQTEIIALKS